MAENLVKDKALFESGYERIDGDRYFTEPWVTRCLLRRLALENLPVDRQVVWEPAAGRGDIVSVLMDDGLRVSASDVDLSEFGPECHAFEADFLQTQFDLRAGGVGAIVTNPPYKDGLAEAFVRKGLAHMENDGVQAMAFLLRSEFSSAKGRVDLFEHPLYAYEVVLTTRPRWDWWRPDAEQGEHGPRHWFSWFVWTHESAFKPSTTYWEGRK